MSSDWTPSAIDPRIEIRFTGGGYQARWELPIPAARIRCAVCRKDLVPLKTEQIRNVPIVTGRKHDCHSSRDLFYPRGYGYVRRRGNVRLFGTIGQAVAVAREKAGFTARPEQVESPEMVSLAEALRVQHQTARRPAT